MVSRTIQLPPDYRGTVIIDDVQKVPALLDQVHRLIEGTSTRFILTGSSPRKLRKRGTNLLAGRALTRNSFPLTAVELGEEFSTERMLKFGHLPTLYDEREIMPLEQLLKDPRQLIAREIAPTAMPRAGEGQGRQ